MQDERTVGHPMRDDILQMPRNVSPTPTGISDNGIMAPKVARMPRRRYGNPLPPRHPRRTTCPTASWTCRKSRTTCAYRRRRSQAHRAAEDSRHKDRETSACQERRARRDAARHRQRHLIGNPIAARPIARETRHIATTPGLDAPSRSPRRLPSRVASWTLPVSSTAVRSKRMRPLLLRVREGRLPTPV